MRDGLYARKKGKDVENATNEIAHNTLTFKIIIIEERIYIQIVYVCVHVPSFVDNQSLLFFSHSFASGIYFFER